MNLSDQEHTRLEKAFEEFKSGILKNYKGLSITNEDRLRELFIDNLEHIVSFFNDMDDGGQELDEIYGDEIYEAVDYSDDED